MTNTDRHPDDLTARARIRDAALAIFAELGEKGATMRGIAERAGVSPALVQHHFGTKARLRSACDEFVLEYFRREVAAGLDDGQIAEPGYAADVYRSAPPVLRYLTRALVDESPGAGDVFDHLVTLSEPYLNGQGGESDPHDRAAVLVAMRLGMIVLHTHLSRNLGAELFSTDGSTRIGHAMLDLLADDLTDPIVLEDARRGVRAASTSRTSSSSTGKESV